MCLRARGHLSSPVSSPHALLHNVDLLFTEAVELVDEFVDLLVGGVDLALEGGLQMLKCKTRPPAFSLLAC